MKNYAIAERHGQWRGDDVGYNALHAYIKTHLTQPLSCDMCGLPKKLDLANISQKYKRVLKDWEWLCRKCHMTKDGRLALAIGRMESKRLADISCRRCKKMFHPSAKKVLNCSRTCAQLSRWNSEMIIIKGTKQ